MHSPLLGVLAALGACFSWGFGDFFIQRTSRGVGIYKALFFIGFTAAVVLLPFVWSEIPKIMSDTRSVLLLLLTWVVALIAALFNFEALKEGKLSIMEPIIGAELPLTALISVAIWGEDLGLVPWLLILVIFIGIVLAVTQHHTHLHYHKRLLEKGVIYAAMTAIGMAFVNVLMGVSSQQTSPIFTVWFVHGMLAAACFAKLLVTGEARTIWSDLKKNRVSVIGQSILDNAGWLAYGYAATLIPIAIVTSISEFYIVVAVVLGLLLNRERLKYHQKVGVAIAAAGVIIISAIVS